MFIFYSLKGAQTTTISITESTISGADTATQTTPAIHSTFKYQSTPTDYSTKQIVTMSATPGETSQSHLVTTGKTTQSHLVTTGETTLSHLFTSGETTHSHLLTTVSTERFPSTARQAINASSRSLDNTTNVDCICTCSLQLNLDDPDILAKHVVKLESLRKALQVEKKSLSNAKRRLVSAPDERPSSKYIGALGIFVLLIISMVIVLPDFIKLCTWLQDRV